jgi:PAS domain S-box-containing protein
VLVGLATLLALTVGRLALADLLGSSTPFLMYFVAVLMAAWSGGLWAGACVTGISALVGYFAFLRALPGIHAADVNVQLVAFSIEGLAMSWLTARLASERWAALGAAQSASEANDKLEAVLHAIDDGITMQDHGGKLVYANRAAARIIGFPGAPELLAAPLAEVMKRFELFDASGASRLAPEQLPNRTLFMGGEPKELLVQFRSAGSSQPHWSLVNAHGVFGDDGRLRFVVNSFRDVTERYRQEEALRVSREWFSTALRSIGDAVIATDASGGVMFLNAVAEQLTGWSASEAAGRRLSDVFRIVNEATRQAVPSPVELVLQHGLVVGLANHTLLLRRDGTEIAIDDSAAPIRGRDAELVGVVLVFRDVTRERRAAERREFLARASVELNSSLDYATTLATVARLAVPHVADWCAVDVAENGALQRLAVAHIDPAKVQLVADLQRRYPPDPQAPRGVPQILRSGSAEMMAQIPDALLESVARDAEHLRLIRELSLHSYIGVPVSRGGTTFGVITLVMAESKRVYTAEDLEFATALADRAAIAIENARLFRAAEQARTDAVLANRAKDDFLAMLGHELRNPLAPIVTALEVMQRRPEGNMERERAVIERQVRHVVRLVDDLLDVSRIIRGRVELAKERVEVADVVNKALELAAPLLEERHHHVQVTAPPGLTILGDPIRLTQVLTNLLTNAAKYTDPGGRIQVSVEPVDQVVQISVRDNGMGIASDMLSTIFDLFVQAPQTIDRSRGGLGLGLTIVQSLVRAFGGTVAAHSAGPGQGSEFVVHLPLSSPPAAEARLPEAAPDKKSRGSVTVLVVDDNVDALEMLVEALRLLGYDAHPAADAQSALTLARTLQPRIALLDIGLPVMDGYELGRRLLALPELPELELVALTGYGQPSDRERSQAAGFSAHLVKPVDLGAIEALLDELTA